MALFTHLVKYLTWKTYSMPGAPNLVLQNWIHFGLHLVCHVPDVPSVLLCVCVFFSFHSLVNTQLLTIDRIWGQSHLRSSGEGRRLRESRPPRKTIITRSGFPSVSQGVRTLLFQVHPLKEARSSGPRVSWERSPVPFLIPSRFYTICFHRKCLFLVQDLLEHI